MTIIASKPPHNYDVFLPLTKIVVDMQFRTLMKDDGWIHIWSWEFAVVIYEQE